MKLFYFDVETTGLDPKDNGIIQMSGIIEIDGEEIETFDFPMRPFDDDLILQSALDVNKIDRDSLESRPSPHVVYEEFIAMLSKYVDKFDKTDKFVVIGYNAAFDTQFLRQWFLKNNDKYYGSWFWHPYIDVMTLAMAHNIKARPVLPDFKLLTVAKFIGVVADEGLMHNALYDVVVTKQLFSRLLRNGGRS